MNNDKLIYARHFIKDYYYEKIDLQSLADTIGYSYDHFRHEFKLHTGYSPIQYVIRQRIDQAKRRLMEGDRTITAVSLECGFSTTAQFSMLFKRHVGVSPTQFRQIHHRRNDHRKELTG